MRFPKQRARFPGQRARFLFPRALRGENAKFERRLGYIERTLAAEGRSLESATLQEMDALWDEAKVAEKTPVVPAK